MGEYDYKWKPCKRLGPIRCVGNPSQQEPGKYQWDCSFKKVSNYKVKTFVDVDYKTIHVEMTPHVDISPLLFILCVLIGCCFAFNYPGIFLLGCLLGDDDYETTTNIS